MPWLHLILMTARRGSRSSCYSRCSEGHLERLIKSFWEEYLQNYRRTTDIKPACLLLVCIFRMVAIARINRMPLSELALF